MSDLIMAGCDLHDRNLLLMAATGAEAPRKRSFPNTRDGRAFMAKWLRELAAEAGAGGIHFAYEASAQGFGLHDELTDAGVACHVLAPSRLPSSPRERKRKTDEADALKILDALRAHLLAGAALPSVWVPDARTRDDREVVRARLDAREKASAVKTQIRSLLKRNAIGRPKPMTPWTKLHRAWLAGLGRGALEPGAAAHLESLRRQLAALEEEIAFLDKAIGRLAEDERHAAPAAELQKRKGVALLTAMVFLTELGDLKRFANRRALAAYLGLAPSCRESGEANDRKGHITRQGPSRVRKVLCQAVWSALAHDPSAKATHERIAGGKARGRKIATVAMMRKLAVLMWHRALEATG